MVTWAQFDRHINNPGVWTFRLSWNNSFARNSLRIDTQPPNRAKPIRWFGPWQLQKWIPRSIPNILLLVAEFYIAFWLFWMRVLLHDHLRFLGFILDLAESLAGGAQNLGRFEANFNFESRFGVRRIFRTTLAPRCPKTGPNYVLSTPWFQSGLSQRSHNPIWKCLAGYKSTKILLSSEWNIVLIAI
jgi:hypothetical protein